MKIFRIAILCFVFIWAFNNSAFAQQFVDAPVEPLVQAEIQGNAPADAAPVIAENIDTYHQFSSGFLSYGWEENVFYQFTNNSSFKGGLNPISQFVNLQYETVMTPGVPYITAISTSYEWYRLEMTSKEVAQKEGINPDLNMTLDQYAFSLKSYFYNDMSPTQDLMRMMKFFVGLGWGWLDGNFSGQDSNIGNINTDFYGPFTYRELGLLMIGENFGGSFSFKIIRADQTRTSSDPYNMAESGERLEMNFGGISTTLSAVARF